LLREVFLLRQIPVDIPGNAGSHRTVDRSSTCQQNHVTELYPEIYKPPEIMATGEISRCCGKYFC
jgi:hypothetical protein